MTPRTPQTRQVLHFHPDTARPVRLASPDEEARWAAIRQDRLGAAETPHPLEN
jgi:hypothetical protein